MVRFVLLAVLACACDDPDALRLVGPPRATLVIASDGLGPYTTVLVACRTTRPIGPTPRANARAQVDVDGLPAEFVSRVGSRRIVCYDAAPVGEGERRTRVGQLIRVEIRARGRVVTSRVRVRRSDPSKSYSWRSPGCAGRKQRG